MSKISDELREWAELLKRGAYAKVTAEKISAFADRIDAEMIELPRDKDGVPIHIRDKTYDRNGNELAALGLELYEEGEPEWMVNCPDGYDPCDLTHERPDSLERIAEELGEFADAYENRDLNPELNRRLHALADRIRTQVKERAK